ncbi:MAG: phospholipase [Dyadobacter sp. 50-39]|uniref:alpha/beta hydrolase family protein n=1 Tax=Dyadobacter sp. 50-39 TaxID=1895756 RepID=UPI00095D4BA3|nr:lipase family protein [Dyadobacter sp. 50-39]OJV17683.1 MAG: phospholipase [Dyadobacter sp. 50-39]
MQKSTSSVLLHRISFLLLWSLILLNSCKDDTKLVPPTEKNVYLKESTSLKTLTKDQVLQQAGSFGPLATAYVKNGVTVYKITYKTKNTDGAEITASGALILPAVSGPVSMISVQHGTIRDEASAPSNFQDDSEAASFGSLFGSMGYIIAYPDYIGYGASKDLPHPYEHRASLASASLDMLRAAKEFLKGQTEVKWDEKLYVAGYSEGGFATMSLQRKIEEEASSEFNLRASSCGAGAYDKTAFMKYIVNSPTEGTYNSLYLWVLLSYDRIYKLNKPASYYFSTEYAPLIAQNGINVNINKSFSTILNDSFKKALNDGTDKGFTDAIADNDVYNFKPKAPTQLYHGTKDPLVFYFNSVNAYNAMQKLGATNVTFIPVEGGTHSSSIITFLIGTLNFFTSTP